MKLDKLDLVETGGGDVLELAAIGVRDIDTRSGNPWHDPRTGRFANSPPGVKLIRGLLSMAKTDGATKQFIEKRRKITKPDAMAAHEENGQLRVLMFRQGSKVDDFTVPAQMGTTTKRAGEKPEAPKTASDEAGAVLNGQHQIDDIVEALDSLYPDGKTGIRIPGDEPDTLSTSELALQGQRIRDAWIADLRHSKTLTPDERKSLKNNEDRALIEHAVEKLELPEDMALFRTWPEKDLNAGAEVDMSAVSSYSVDADVPENYLEDGDAIVMVRVPAGTKGAPVGWGLEESFGEPLEVVARAGKMRVIGKTTIETQWGSRDVVELGLPSLDVPDDQLDFPKRLTKGWMQKTLGSLDADQAKQVIAKLRSTGWGDRKNSLPDRVYPLFSEDVRKELNLDQLIEKFGNGAQKPEGEKPSPEKLEAKGVVLPKIRYRREAKAGPYAKTTYAIERDGERVGTISKPYGGREWFLDMPYDDQGAVYVHGLRDAKAKADRTLQRWFVEEQEAKKPKPELPELKRYDRLFDQMSDFDRILEERELTPEERADYERVVDERNDLVKSNQYRRERIAEAEHDLAVNHVRQRELAREIDDPKNVDKDFGNELADLKSQSYDFEKTINDWRNQIAENPEIADDVGIGKWFFVEGDDGKLRLLQRDTFPGDVLRVNNELGEKEDFDPNAPVLRDSVELRTRADREIKEALASAHNEWARLGNERPFTRDTQDEMTLMSKRIRALEARDRWLTSEAPYRVVQQVLPRERWERKRAGNPTLSSRGYDIESLKKIADENLSDVTDRNDNVIYEAQIDQRLLRFVPKDVELNHREALEIAWYQRKQDEVDAISARLDTTNRSVPERYIKASEYAEQQVKLLVRRARIRSENTRSAEPVDELQALHWDRFESAVAMRQILEAGPFQLRDAAKYAELLHSLLDAIAKSGDRRGDSDWGKVGTLRFTNLAQRGLGGLADWNNNVELDAGIFADLQKRLQRYFASQDKTEIEASLVYELRTAIHEATHVQMPFSERQRNLWDYQENSGQLIEEALTEATARIELHKLLQEFGIERIVASGSGGKMLFYVPEDDIIGDPTLGSYNDKIGWLDAQFISPLEKALAKMYPELDRDQLREITLRKLQEIRAYSGESADRLKLMDLMLKRYGVDEGMDLQSHRTLNQDARLIPVVSGTDRYELSLEAELDEFEQMMLEEDPTLKSRATQIAIATGLDQTYVTRALIGHAAAKDTEAEMRDYALYQVAAKELGFGEVSIPDRAREIAESDNERLSKLARALYSREQESYGPVRREVKLYRGDVVGRGVYEGQTLRSWTDDPDIASQFGDVYEEWVPIERILSSYKTGLGTEGEREYLVFDASPELKTPAESRRSPVFVASNGGVYQSLDGTYEVHYQNGQIVEHMTLAGAINELTGGRVPGDEALTPEQRVLLGDKWQPPPVAKGINAGRGGAGGYTSDKAETTLTDLGREGEALFAQLTGGEILHPEGKGEQSPLDVRFDGYGFEVKTTTTNATHFKASPKPHEQASKEQHAKELGVKPALAIVVIDRDTGQAHVYWREGLKGGRLSRKTGWKYMGSVDTIKAAGSDSFALDRGINAWTGGISSNHPSYPSIIAGLNGEPMPPEQELTESERRAGPNYREMIRSQDEGLYELGKELARSPLNDRTLYRGLLVDRIPVSGDHIDMSVSSWTLRRTSARGVAQFREQMGQGGTLVFLKVPRGSMRSLALEERSRYPNEHEHVAEGGNFVVQSVDGNVVTLEVTNAVPGDVRGPEAGLATPADARQDTGEGSDEETARAWIEENWSKADADWSERLGVAPRVILDEYQATSKSINDHLRMWGMPGPEDVHGIDVRMMDNALTEHPGLEEDTTLWRGMRKLFLGEDLKIGDRITDAAFMSTSESEHVARAWAGLVKLYDENNMAYPLDSYLGPAVQPVVVEIRVPKGTKAIAPDFSPTNEIVRERILARGSTLVIREIREETTGIQDVDREGYYYEEDDESPVGNRPFEWIEAVRDMLDFKISEAHDSSEYVQRMELSRLAIEKLERARLISREESSELWALTQASDLDAESSMSELLEGMQMIKAIEDRTEINRNVAIHIIADFEQADPPRHEMERPDESEISDQLELYANQNKIGSMIRFLEVECEISDRQVIADKVASAMLIAGYDANEVLITLNAYGLPEADEDILHYGEEGY